MDSKTFHISRSPAGRRRGVVQALRRGSAGLGLAVGLTMLSAGGALAMQPEGTKTARAAAAVAPEAMSDRLIVKMRPGPRSARAADPSARPAMAVAGNRAGLRITRLRGMGIEGAHVLKLDKPLGLSALRTLADEMRAGDSEIEYVEPDLIMRPQWIPNDPLLGQQWHYTESAAGINLPAAWDVSTGRGVVVAVVDGGVNPHADLAAHLLPGYDFITLDFMANDGGGRDDDPRDPGDATTANFCGDGAPARASSWHGTHVAGTIAAVTHNGLGVAGVAPDARILPLRALGRCGGFTSDITDAVIWAVGGTVLGVPANPNPAQVVNLSLGGKGSCGRAWQDAINLARGRGAVVVVAAGNDGADASGYTPASCPGVISVAAADRSGGRAWYSNFGPAVDVAAPGGDEVNGIYSTSDSGAGKPVGDSYRMLAGTSMAAPHVSGVVALMRAAQPGLTPDEIEARLKASAGAREVLKPCADCGAGIVDAGLALGGEGVKTEVIREVEPNDTPSTGQKVTQRPAKVEGRTDRVAEVDYYEVVIPAGKRLEAVLKPSAKVDLELNAFRLDGTLLSAGKPVFGAGQPKTLAVVNTGKTAMTIALKVYPRASRLPGASNLGGKWPELFRAVGTYELTLVD